MRHIIYILFIFYSTISFAQSSGQLDLSPMVRSIKTYGDTTYYQPGDSIQIPGQRTGLVFVGPNNTLRTDTPNIYRNEATGQVVIKTPGAGAALKLLSDGNGLFLFNKTNNIPVNTLQSGIFFGSILNGVETVHSYIRSYKSKDVASRTSKMVLSTQVDAVHPTGLHIYGTKLYGGGGLTFTDTLPNNLFTLRHPGGVTWPTFMLLDNFGTQVSQVSKIGVHSYGPTVGDSGRIFVSTGNDTMAQMRLAPSALPSNIINNSFHNTGTHIYFTLNGVRHQLDQQTVGIPNYWQRNSTVVSPATITDQVGIGTTSSQGRMLNVVSGTDGAALFKGTSQARTLDIKFTGLGSQIQAYSDAAGTTASNLMLNPDGGGVGVAGASASSPTIGFAVGSGNKFQVNTDGKISGYGSSNIPAGSIIQGVSNVFEMLPIGTAGQQLRVNSGATAVEYFNPNLAPISVSSAGTGNITNAFRGFVFTGTTATWTLPPVASNTGFIFFIVNKGSGNITLNSNVGGNDIWEGGSVTNTKTIIPGETYRVLCDGVNFDLSN